MAYLQLTIAAVFFTAGLLIKYKKAVWLIIGYHSRSLNQKNQPDNALLCRAFGNFALWQSFYWAFLAALCLLLPAYMPHITVIGCAFFTVLLLLGINYINTAVQSKN